jgi:prefoldin subunit 5
VTRVPVMVPLTSSLYVRGNLENVGNPMVEIGTG